MERMVHREELLEYFAALPTAAIYNVNRGRNTRFLHPQDLMWRQQLRRRSTAAGTVAAPTMRYARPGERPPSRFAPGEPDGVIDRFDAYAKRLRGKK